MCARFTVLSDAPIAAAIAGCVIPLSRKSTICMRWRCAAGIFHRSAVFSRRTSALLHLTIWPPPNQMVQANHTSGEENSPPKRSAYLPSKSRFTPLWRWYKTTHFVVFNEETVIQVHGVGPWAINYVNPADDPRKKTN